MKALTIWQPWASLIAGGFKPYEFRGWAAPRYLIGKRIAIHAGARPIKPTELADLIRRLASPLAWSTALRPEAKAFLERVRSDPSVLPLSSIIATAVVGEPRRGTEVVSEFGGPVNDSDRDAHSNWAWPLGAVEPVQPMVPMRGAQGFWEWTP